MVLHYENTVTSRYSPEVCFDFLTDYNTLDHDSEFFRKENGGELMKRDITRLPGSKVHLVDHGKRFTNDLTVDLSDRPNRIPTEGMRNFGPWKGMTTISPTPDGGTSWHSEIQITPDRIGAKILFAFIGGALRKSFIKHEKQHFVEMEAKLRAT